MLLPSSLDDVMLCKAVEEKFLETCALYERQHEMCLPIPESLTLDLLRWRRMRMRHKKHDRRHTEPEMQSLRMVAQFVLDAYLKLRNQPPKVIEWVD